MNPSDIKSMTLSQLRATRKAMFSAQWMLALETADPATRTSAAQQMLAVNHAIVTLENGQLDSIRQQLIANEADLTASAQTLTNALTDLSKVNSVLTAITGFLGIIGKIVPLLLPG
ncbi:MAG TPA: hypothetical protein DDZ76_11775 [Xanthomonadales bacterium]|nr:hypothetical protein [Xanthomonadales bacterium]